MAAIAIPLAFTTVSLTRAARDDADAKVLLGWSAHHTLQTATRGYGDVYVGAIVPSTSGDTTPTYIDARVRATPKWLDAIGQLIGYPEMITVVEIEIRDNCEFADTDLQAFLDIDSLASISLRRDGIDTQLIQQIRDTGRVSSIEESPKKVTLHLTSR